MVDTSKDLYLIVAAMYRSGHHAVMQWITSNLPMNTKFVEAGITAFSAFCSNYVPIKSGYDSDVYPIDIENFWSNDEPSVKALHAFDDRQVLKILVIRDPFNCLSSIMKLKGNSTELFSTMLDIYRDNVASSEGEDFDLTIYFNDIISSRDYREKIGALMGIESTCKNWLGYVTKDGSGSSFDGLHYQSDPLSMDLSRRYVHLDVAQINTILEDSVIRPFCNRHFTRIVSDVREYLKTMTC